MKFLKKTSGLVLLAAVAGSLASCTYIENSLGNKFQGDDIGFAIDSITTPSLKVSAAFAIGDIITIAEPNTSDPTLPIRVVDSKIEQTDFSVTLESVSINATMAWLKKNKVTHIKLRMRDDATTLTRVPQENIHLTHRGTDSVKTYVEPTMEEFLFPVTYVNGRYVLLNPSEAKVTFQWGSFFDNKAPSTYYNDYLRLEDGTFPDYDEMDHDLTLIEKEMSAMISTLSDKTFAFMAEAVTEAL